MAVNDTSIRLRWKRYGAVALFVCAGLGAGASRAIAQTTYRVQHSSGTSVATGITTNSETCGGQAKYTVVTLLSTSAFDCSSDRIEAPAGQVIFDAYVSTAYAQDTVVTGQSFSMRIRSNGATSTVSAQLFYVSSTGTRTFIGSAVNSSSISSEATYTVNLSSQSATVPAGSKLGLRLRSNGPEFRWYWGSSYGVYGGTLVVSEVSASATTTLGTGVDPSGATVAPSGDATLVDAFTLQTSSGTDTITAVAVSLSVGSSAGVSLVEITDNGGGTVYGSVTTPSSDTIAVALAPSISVTTTSTQYKVRVTPKAHAALPAPPGSIYAVTAAVTGWTGANGHAGSDTAGTTVAIDNLSPGDVSGSTATAGNAVVWLAWTPPADADLASVIVVRRSGSAVTDAPTEGMSYSVGDTIGSSVVACVAVVPLAACADTGLTNGTPYHYKIFARDSRSNDAIGIVPAGSPATPVAGITVTPTSGLVTSESGTAATFSLVLLSPPSADVTVALTSSDPAEGIVAPATVTFTAATWNTAQTVTVTGVDDPSVDGNRSFVVQTAATISADPTYHGVDPADVSVTNTDDDTAAVTVSPASGLTTSEAGGTATFSVLLNSRPAADVTIAVSSSDDSEGTIAMATVTLTPATWNVVQTVTVVGVDDFVEDGEQTYSIITAAATSDDPSYHGLDVVDVAVRNADNDTAGVSVTPTGGLVTTESGGTAAFSVVLTSQPTAVVTVALSPSDTTEGSLSPATISFTAADWNVPQAVTVTGLADAVDDGDVGFSVVTAPATSADPAYDGVNASDVDLTNVDTDSAGIAFSATAGLVTTEAGGTATGTIVLTSRPSADVTISLIVSDSTEGAVAPASMTFGASTWSIPQALMVTGVDDALHDGSVTFDVVASVHASGDAAYAASAPVPVSVTNLDDDIPGITVTPAGGLVTSETGGTATFTVALTALPAGDVSIALSSNDTSEGTVSPGTLTFTAVNWHVPQEVTVAGVDDNVVDGSRNYTIITGPTVSADSGFAGIDPPDVGVTNVDDDRAGITVTPATGLVTSEAGRTATVAIVLNTQPMADVAVALSVTAATEVTVRPATVQFTPADWNVAQTVWLTGLDDHSADGSAPFVMVTAPATSADTAYDGLDAADAGGVNVDDDTPGVSVSPAAGLVTTERGGTATFAIVLNTRPAADVTIPLTSGRPAEGTIAPTHVTFTPLDWHVPKTVTLTGVNDAMSDGPQLYLAILGPAASADDHYAGLDGVDVGVSNLDDDVVGVEVMASHPQTTTEAGGTTSFRVVLRTRPSTNVDVPIASFPSSEGVVSPAFVTFTPDNWDAPVTVTVTGIDDGIEDGAAVYRVVIGPTAAGDVAYHSLPASEIRVTNLEVTAVGRPSGGPGGGAVADAPGPDPLQTSASGLAPDVSASVSSSASSASPAQPSAPIVAAAADAAPVDSPPWRPVPSLVVQSPTQPEDAKRAMPEYSAPEIGATDPTDSAVEPEHTVRGALPTVRNIGARRVDKDTVLEISRAKRNEITLIDADGEGHHLVVSLVARHGRLRLATTQGLTFTQGTATGATAVTFMGRVDAVNTALDGLMFQPDSSYFGEAGLCIDASHPPRRTDIPSLCVDRVEALWQDAADGARIAVWVPILVTPLSDPVAPVLGAP